MSRKMLFLALLVLLLAVTPLMAQDDDALAYGLNNPRHLFYDREGSLYVVEAGNGGDTAVEGPYGPVKAGLQGQVTVVSPDGEQTVLLSGFISMDAGFGQIEGPMAIIVTDTSYWVAEGLGPKEAAFEGPYGKYVEVVLEIDRATLEVRQVIDLRAFEVANNPDKGDELISNPADLAVGADGTLYIADASANAVLSWTEEGGLKLFAAWPVDATGAAPQAVPTSLAVGPDGDIYVGFLSGFPFAAEAARIERYSVDGTLKQTYRGLTLVTDIAVTEDGSLYAVEMASGFGDAGFIPNSGRIVLVAANGLTPVVEGINFPYSFAQTPDGEWVVTVNSAFAMPDSGMVLRADKAGHMGGAEPAGTPEASS